MVKYLIYHTLTPMCRIYSKPQINTNFERLHVGDLILTFFMHLFYSFWCTAFGANASDNTAIV